MFSACQARLITNLVGNRLQLITSCQVNSDNCHVWGSQLKNNNELLEAIPKVNPILDRLISEPEFMVGMIHHNSIITGVIKLTASFEYFLNDLISLCMMRNYGLLKKGLKDVQVSPFDIVEFSELKEIRYKYIEIIAQNICKGELWSKKLKRVCSFLEVSNKYYSDQINSIIDSIWTMRNVIAHGDSRNLRFVDNGITIEHTEDSINEEYIKFITAFIKAADILEQLMLDLDREALEKWPAKDFEKQI